MIEPKGPRWPKLTVALVARRDTRRCIHCGVVEGLGVQHRGVKGAGGRNSAERPSNGIILCNLLNVALEQDAALSAWAEERGWKISSHADPSTLPVFDANLATWFDLHDDFTRTKVA